MPRTVPKPKSASKFSIYLRILVLALLAGLTLAGSGFAFAASQEAHDNFCSSCHTQPETTFYQYSLANPAVDLASAHAPNKTRCIDCHSGKGIIGRMQAELLGAHNALAFYTHTAVQPAVLTKPVGDATCMKCHMEITTRQLDINNHFHIFLTRWQAVDKNAATCVSCHKGHATNGSPQLMWLNQDETVRVCETCHERLGGGE